MRVLFVSQEFPPETGWGGIGTYVDVLSEALAAKGIDVHVLSVVEGQPESTREVGDVTVHRRSLPTVSGLHRLPPQAWRRTWLSITVARLIRRLGLGPSVVECPEWGAEGLSLALRGDTPLVVRLHSSARQLFPFTGQGREWRGIDGHLSAWLEETSARRANVVISTRSNLDEVAARMRLNDSALHAIPYPVRLPSPSPIPATTSPRVLFVGRLEPRKGPEVLLRAAPTVLASVPNARFVFVGRDAVVPGAPPSTEWLRREAQRLGVAGAVELTGQLTPEGVTDQLRQATVCAFPSRWESFGNVVAEASACGRPVVASSIPPFRELVDDGVTGSIVPQPDAEAWAAALIDLLSDSSKAGAMGHAGPAHVAGISTPERVADLTLSAYEHAIQRWSQGQRAAGR
jgi:glycosyltransferase involved in cell wall biosynthesis